MSQGGNILYDRRLARLEVVRPSIVNLSDTLRYPYGYPDADMDYTFLELPPAAIVASEGLQQAVIQLLPRSIDNPFKTLVVLPPEGEAADPQRRFKLVIKFGQQELITLNTVFASAVLLWKAGKWAVVKSTSTSSSTDRYTLNLALTPLQTTTQFDNASTMSIANRVMFVHIDFIFQVPATGPHGVLSLAMPPEFQVTDTLSNNVVCVDDLGFLSPATINAYDNTLHLQVFMFDRDRVYTCKGQFFAPLVGG